MPVADDVAVPAALREDVARLTPAAAVARLQALNPGGLGTLDTANPRRVSRALERCLASGRPLAELAADFARLPGPFAGWRIELTRIERSPEELNRRIEARVAAMMRDGLVAEVRQLLDAGLKENPSASRAIGYREMIAGLERGTTEEKMAEEIAQNTRALVKKQRTWFRTQLPEHRMIPAADLTVAGLFPA